MKTGTIIKSFDFHGNTSHYMIGRVESVTDGLITCTTIKRVVDGEESGNKPATFTTPANGEHFMDNGKFTRVHVIG